MTVRNFVIAVLVALATPVFADEPSFAIFPPIQYPPEDATVMGGRLSIGWARHKNVYGMDIGGIGNITDGNFVGLAASTVFHETRGKTYILLMQAGLIFNRNSGDAKIFGLQGTLGANINGKSASVYGFQIAGLANLGRNTDIFGLQAGLYNEARNVYGLQIGVVNYAANLHGVQIGLLNIHAKGLIKYFPVLNIGF